MEDKRCCSNCGHELHQRPYLMAREAPENVLSWRAIAWIVVAAVVMAYATT